MAYRYARAQSDDASFAKYAQLFSECFPTALHLRDLSYLSWLYRDNPAGPVVGFDAYMGDRLAAHYVCIPADLEVDGYHARGLLSLNTATHPEHQGKGLFTALAKHTYEAGMEEGFAMVYGVANASSTPGFTRKLGFDNVGALQARLGFGQIIDDAEALLARPVGFRRCWDESSMNWRIRNPRNASYAAKCFSDNVTRLWCPTDKTGVKIVADLPTVWVPSLQESRSAPISANLWLGMLPAWAKRAGFYREVPQRLRPSPLNFIVRDLRDYGNVMVRSDNTFFSYLDFDAY